MTKKDSKGSDQKKMTKKNLQHFIGLLKDGDNFEKEKAIDALIASPTKEVVEGIIPLLQESNTPTRMAVLDVLKKIGSVHVEGVIGMLYDDNEDIRVYGCEVLSFLKDKRAIPDLVEKLYNDADNVRNAACVALGDFDDDEAVRALLKALDDVEWIAFSAIYSIGRTKSPLAVPKLIDFFKTSTEELSIAACEVLIDYEDDKVLNEIFETLKGWDREKRGAHLKIILEKGNEEIFQKLKNKIGDELYEHLLNNLREEKKFSLEVIRMLTHFRHPDTCQAILNVLAQMGPDDEEFNAVLEFFCALRDVWVPSVEAYINRDERYIFPLIKACKLVAVKLDEPFLLKVFLSAGADIKREIITGFPDIVEGKGTTVISEAIKDTDGHIKGYAVEAVGKMCLAEMKDEIIEIVRKGFADVRVKALKVLVGLDAEKAMELMKQFVYEGTSDDKKIYLAATSLVDSESNFPFIEKLANDEDEGVRRTSISVMGSFVENNRYVNLLKEILVCDDIPHEVLKVIKDKKLDMFKDRLIEIFHDMSKGLWTRYYALAALGAFEDKSLFDIFTGGLNDENSLITIGCIKALADLNEPRAKESIMPFGGSSNEDVRAAAEAALEKLWSM